MMALSIFVFAVGALVVAATLGSAVRSVVLPRAIPARLTRRVFLSVRALFRLRAGPKASYEKRDRVMALYAPVSLLTLVLVWECAVLIGYAFMFWSVGAHSVRQSFALSGSSLLTLGFKTTGDLPGTGLVISEAALGLLLLALLISFLPSLYSTFSRREAAVTLLEVRAGSPPTAVEMLIRYWRIHGLDRLGALWPQWEIWFGELDETHTSFPALAFFRSPRSENSWVTASGAVLDAAALRASTIDLERQPEAELCIRAGYLALRHIAAFFRIPFDDKPSSDDPISISRDEYDAAYEALELAGLPLKTDRDQAWRDFSGWRVNYDTVLLSLAQLTMAPTAKWSSDREPLRASTYLTRVE